MRRKNRKWVALAVIIYLGIMVAAFHWSASQRLPGEDNLLTKIIKKDLQRRAAERAEQDKLTPRQTGESRLTAAGPAYIAARYDDSHIAFIVTTDTESRFASSPWIRQAALTKVSASTRPSAPLAGLQELWEPDTQSLHFFPKIIQGSKPGDQWILTVSPTITIPVAIDRAIVAPTGCNLALGFLAEVPADQQTAFATAPADYFAVRRAAVEPADPQLHSSIAELNGYKLGSAAAKQVEQQLSARMQQELAHIDADLRANAGTPGATANEMPIANPLPRLKEWLHVDKALAAGAGKLDYDVHAYTLSPDQSPRLLVRARWILANTPVFLMTAWFKEEKLEPQSKNGNHDKPGAPLLPEVGRSGDVSKPNPTLTLLFADSSWSKQMREGEAAGKLGDDLDFTSVLNQFDADHDGWAELLMHSYQKGSSVLALYLYTDETLVPIKAPLTHEFASADACLDP